MKIHLIDCQKKNRHHYSNLISGAFKNLGHEVFEFDSGEYPNFYLKIDRFIKRSPLYLTAKFNSAKYDFKEKQRAYVSNEWLQTINEFKPDLILMLNNSFITRDAIQEAKKKLKVKKIVCWVVDDPSRPQAEDLVGLLPHCDIVFSTDPGWINFIRFFNKSVFYLPLASSDACYKPLNISKRYDLSFIGSFFRKDPAGYFRAYTLSRLPSSYKAVISGPGITFFQKLYPQLNSFDCRDQYVSIEAVNELYNSSAMTASLYHPQVIEGISPRVFEVALSKTFQLIQDTPTIHELFRGIKLPVFRSTEEFLERADYYLNHPKERQELAEEIYSVAKSKHQFTHRLKKFIEVVYT